MTNANSTTLYEILFRMHERTGGFKGAHIVRWRHVVIDGEVIRDSEMAPEPLSLDNEADISTVVAGVNTASLVRVAELEARLAQYESAASMIVEDAQ